MYGLSAAQFNQTFLKSITEMANQQSSYALKDMQYIKIFDVTNDPEVQRNYTTIESTSGAQTVPEGGTIPVGSVGKGYKVTFMPEKEMVSMTVTYEMYRNAMDNTQRAADLLQGERRFYMNDVANRVQTKLYNVFNDAFAGNEVLAPDGEALISATHKWNSSNTTRSNLLPAAAFDQSVLDTIFERFGAFTDAAGKPVPFTAKFLVAKKGGKASRDIKKVIGINDKQYHPTTVANINIYQGIDNLYLIETPYITSGTAYFVLADYNAVAFPNPLFLNFYQTPSVYGEFERIPNTPDLMLPFIADFSFGLKEMPAGIMGSVGA